MTSLEAGIKEMQDLVRNHREVLEGLGIKNGVAITAHEANSHRNHYLLVVDDRKIANDNRRSTRNLIVLLDNGVGFFLHELGELDEHSSSPAKGFKLHRVLKAALGIVLTAAEAEAEEAEDDPS